MTGHAAAAGPKKVLCVGGATVDIIAGLADENIEKMSLTNATSSYLLLETGRKVEAESVDRYFGGGAVNAAVSLTRLGSKADCFVKLGQDRYGDEILAHMQKYGIGTQHIVRSDSSSTAMSVLISSHDRDPTILTYRGANTRIKNLEVPWDSLRDYDALYVTNLSNESADIFPKLVAKAHSLGLKVISNPGIRQLSRADDDFLTLLPHLSVLVLNRVEAEALMLRFLEHGKPKQSDLMSKCEEPIPKLISGAREMEVRDFLHSVHGSGTNIIVLTDGSNFHCHQPQKTRAVGTVGAGDAFSSTFAHFWINKTPIEQAIKAATQNAASAVSTIDAQSGLLTREELTTMTKSSSSAA